MGRLCSIFAILASIKASVVSILNIADWCGLLSGGKHYKMSAVSAARNVSTSVKITSIHTG